jgi:hypothetical protein
MWKKLKSCRTKRHQTRKEYLITLTRLKDYIRFWFNRAPPAFPEPGVFLQKSSRKAHANFRMRMDRLPPCHWMIGNGKTCILAILATCSS